LDNIKIITKRFYLRNLTSNDATKEYLSWLSDVDIKKNIDRSNKKESDLVSLQKFIENANKKKDVNFKKHEEGLGKEYTDKLRNIYSTDLIKVLFLGIFDKDNNKHVGNIKFEPIDLKEKIAVMGILIGNSDYRGKGVFKEVFLATSEYLNNKFNISKIFLGLKKNNNNALEAYKKFGFKIHKQTSKFIYMNVLIS